jgi:16S rRNA (guanine527-N7)-methyltransferase
MGDFSRFELHDEQVNKLESYSSLMLKWNKRIQMTATRDLKEFVGRHVIDSLELAADVPAGPGRMLDVGSGGGLPGIILAIARPDMEFTLIEPTQKKHAFLSTARRELSLGNLRTFAIRDEELLEREDFALFDYAVARAVWALDTWLERGRALVRPGGIIFAMEGREESQLPDGCVRRRYQLSGERQRSIVQRTMPAGEVS